MFRAVERNRFMHNACSGFSRYWMLLVMPVRARGRLGEQYDLGFKINLDTLIRFVSTCHLMELSCEDTVY